MSKSESSQSDKQGAAWYAVKDSESYSSVRYKAVLHEAHGEQEVWIARELAHHIAQQIADDHNRARRPGGDWYRRKIEQTGEEPHAIGPLSAGVAISSGSAAEWTDQELADLLGIEVTRIESRNEAAPNGYRISGFLGRSIVTLMREAERRLARSATGPCVCTRKIECMRANTCLDYMERNRVGPTADNGAGHNGGVK